MARAPRTSEASILDVLRARSEEEPGDLAFRFLPDGTSASAQDWTNLDLARNAAVVADALREHGVAGDRVLLALNPGLHYVAALFGIFAAGATAVPCFPPIGRRARGRFGAILLDCQPAVVVLDRRFQPAIAELDAQFALLPRPPRWLFLDDEAFADAASVAPVGSAPLADLALLQYTSGSTGQPKGVMLTHDNILSNCVVLESNMGFDPDRVGCSWLPPYHDMGLMGTILLALHAGWPLVMMTPMHFVQNPYRWLKAITDNAVTISVTPNSALDLTTDSVTDDELATLDLSSLRQLYCGSEPVFTTTLDRFRERFGPCGYSASAVIPCYGLAEATLFVSGRRQRDGGITTLQLDKDALERGFVEAVPAGAESARQILSCGAIADRHEVLVVDPTTLAPLPPTVVGEIWVKGPSVTAGYYHRPDETEATFGGRLPESEGTGRYLRTGDLGFLLDGELYVTGRLKDLIVISGRNIYPQDVELSVQTACPSFRRVAAFSVRGEASEELVVVAEVRDVDGLGPSALTELREAVVAEVTAEHGVRPSDVCLTPVASIPLTTSGKVRRDATRRAYQQGQLKQLALVAD